MRATSLNPNRVPFTAVVSMLLCSSCHFTSTNSNRLEDIEAAKAFGEVVAHALEENDSTTVSTLLDTSLTWKKLLPVFKMAQDALGHTDSLRVVGAETLVKVVDGDSSIFWQISLTGYHGMGLSRQTVGVQHIEGRPRIIGYHVNL